MSIDLSALSEAITIPPVEDVRRVKNIMIPMRDGVKLAADLYIPAGADLVKNPLPVVMEYIPYRKDQVDLAGRPFYLYMPRNGYIFVRVDIRGTGASEGVSLDEYVLQEQLDGYDAVEWLAAQPWCDGCVNMMGISYGGFTALQVAAHNPPHLTSIIPVDFTDDRYRDECHYKGGLMRLYYNLAYYGGFMIAWNAMPPLPETSGEGWADRWEEHIRENEPYILNWYRNQVDGPFWRHGSVGHEPDRIKCPVFMIGGWLDGYMNTPMRLYEKLSVPRKVIIGPWNHAMPDAAIPGPRIDYLAEVVRWLDYWCKNKANGIMDEPSVIVYMQESEPPVVDRLETKGHWRAEKEWPPPGAGEQTFFLAEEARLAQTPGNDSEDGLVYNPTVGIHGGLFSGGIQFGLPGDQRPDEALSLVYTTPPLEEDLHILGRAKAILNVSSTASVIGFAASLSDVSPDGASQLVGKGALNATRRNSLSDPEPLIPGEKVELTIEIDSTGWVFKKGNRIRLSLANADWPNLWPTPEPAQSLVYTGKDLPSRLMLPVVPEKGSAAPPEFMPSKMKKSRHSDSPEPPTWEVSRDLLTGRTKVTIGVGGTQRITPHSTLKRESIGCFEVDPADPARAGGRGSHVLALFSGNQVIQACSEIFVQASASHFHIAIDLTVSVNGAAHASRRWVESVPRQML